MSTKASNNSKSSTPKNRPRNWKLTSIILTSH